MSRVVVIFLNLLIVFSLIPQLNLTFAADPCKQVLTANGQYIDYFPVDASGNKMSHIPDNIKAVRIKFINLSPGYYRIELPKGGPPADSDIQPSVNGTVILTITDPDKLTNDTHAGNLQESDSGDFNPLKKGDGHGDTYDEQFCRDVRYHVGYQKDTCIIKTIPSKPVSNQKYMVEVTNAPAGDFEIVFSDKPGLFSHFDPVIAHMTIGDNGRGVSDLLKPLNRGTYQIYLAKGPNLVPIPVPGKPIPGAGTNDPDTRMCYITLPIVSAISSIPTPSCALLSSDKDYKLRAFNLMKNTNYEVSLEKPDGTANNLGNQSSGADGQFDVTLVDLTSTSNPQAGKYIGSMKDSNGQQCEVDFSLGSTGDLVPNSVVSVKTCTPDDPTCTHSGLEPCIPTGSHGDSGIPTAIGCIPTEFKDFVTAFLRFATGISGGLAFLMMILGAFQMLTSAGNPESLQAGRDRFTSAIIGLLLIIFAVLLMQIIGVGILNIPGFGR